jgi:hypothetical protein
MSKQDYEIKELQRQMKGVQRQLGVQHALQQVTAKKLEQRVRDLEITTAAQSGVPQKKLAKIYDLSQGRVSQIVRKHG